MSPLMCYYLLDTGKSVWPVFAWVLEAGAQAPPFFWSGGGGGHRGHHEMVPALAGH